MIAASWTDLTPIIIAVVGGGGIIGAVVAFIKVRPEAGQIAVSASQGALVVQTGVITTLREEVDRANGKLEHMSRRMMALEAETAKVDQLRERVDELEKEKTRLRGDNTRLRRRVDALEKQIRDLGHQPVENGGE